MLLVAAAAGVWTVLRTSDGDAPGREATTVARDAAPDDEARPPVVLQGRPDARAAPPTATAPGAEAPKGPADAAKELAELQRQIEERQREALAAQREAARLEAPALPVRPDRPDPALGDPYRTPRVGRIDLLGRRVAGPGPWIPDGRGLVFTGVAKIDHEDAGAAVEEEITEPLVTAVLGTVLSDGEPVAGAEVVLYSAFYQRHARYDHHVREVGRMVTDGYGVFDLRPIGLDTVHFGSNGEVLITIHKPGYGSIVARRLDNIQPEVENDLGTFVLARESSTLVGTVRDMEGRPVQGAAVRVSGSVNPVLYDKTERMIILEDCPTAITDDEGAYRLASFATGLQHLSIHVNIDCVQHFASQWPAGEHRYDARVQAGHFIKGVVVDEDGQPVAAAVVSSGDNWTPSNADGTFWLDNIVPHASIDLQVVHHLFASTMVPDVAVDTEDVEIVLTTPLPRIELVVATEETGEVVPLITLDWSWTGGGPPHRFVPTSRNWHAADGRYDVVVPEGASGVLVGAAGRASVPLDAPALEDGHVSEVALPPAS